MVLHVARACAALRQGRRIGRERRPVPRRERDEGVSQDTISGVLAASEGGGEHLARVEEGVALGADAVDAALGEEGLAEEEDGEDDADEDGGGGAWG